MQFQFLLSLLLVSYQAVPFTGSVHRRGNEIEPQIALEVSPDIFKNPDELKARYASLKRTIDDDERWYIERLDDIRRRLKINSNEIERYYDHLNYIHGVISANPDNQEYRKTYNEYLADYENFRKQGNTLQSEYENVKHKMNQGLYESRQKLNDYKIVLRNTYNVDV